MLIERKDSPGKKWGPITFFRGQRTDHLNKANKPTFYPKIYRGDYLQQREVNYRFEILDNASKLIVTSFV